MKKAAEIQKRIELLEGFIEGLEKDRDLEEKDVEQKIRDNASDPRYVRTWIDHWFMRVDDINVTLEKKRAELEVLYYVKR